MNRSSTRFYTKQEVADILKVSLRTINRYMGYAGLPYRKIRGTVRIPEDEFFEWVLKERKVEVETQPSLLITRIHR